MIPQKICKITHAVMAILVLFEHFSSKLCINFLTLILSTSPNMLHFVRTFSIVRALGVRLIVIEKVRNYGKFVFIKNVVEKGW